MSKTLTDFVPSARAILFVPLPSVALEIKNDDAWALEGSMTERKKFRGDFLSKDGRLRRDLNAVFDFNGSSVNYAGGLTKKVVA